MKIYIEWGFLSLKWTIVFLKLYNLRNMKILLIQPPIEDFYQTPIRTKPIGLAYIASCLKKSGHEVEILDCQTKKRKPIPIPRELSYLSDFYPFNDKSPFKLYSRYYHFGMAWSEIKKRIIESKPDICGISSSFTPYHNEALKVAQIVKDFNAKNIVVMGGAHVCCDPRGVLKSPYIDYVILGEGEYRFPALIDIIRRGKTNELSEIDGLGYRENGEIKINPLKEFIKDLDSIPYPARELLQLNRYRINKKLYTMIITSRGCPHKCTYCSVHLIMGKRFRSRNPENIIKEIKECHEKFGIEIFDIEDDNFTYDRERSKRLMRFIIDTFGEERIELSAMNGVSFATLDKELIGLMKKAGFKSLNLSLVSSSPSIKEYVKRPYSILDFDQVIKESVDAGLRIISYAIFGIPGQRLEDMIDTLIYLMGKRVLIGPSIYYPVPGTLLFENCKQKGFLPDSLLKYRSTAFPIETEDFSRLDLVTIFRLTRMINFIKAKIEEGTLEDGITLRGIFNYLRSKLPVNEVSWIGLVFKVLEEGSFFSLRNDPEGKLVMTKEKSSERVLSYFFKKAWEKPILRYH